MTRTPRTDAQLLASARRDPNAFRELYDRYAGPIHGYHHRRTGDADVALDLTAETFAQAWLCRTRFEDRAAGSAGPWLFAIARHLLLLSVRRRQLERSACLRLGVLERLDSEPAQSEPQESWLDGLDEALDHLPEDQRQAIVMRVEGDLCHDEIASRAQITPQAARTRVSRGLTTLRRRLAHSKEAL
jgi:RNA polymerase sigma-70 factor (ECF subfamily)